MEKIELDCKRPKQRSVLKRRLFITLCCVSIIPALVLSLMNYNRTYNSMLDMMRENTYDTLCQIDARVKDLTDSVENVLLGIQVNRDLIRRLSDKGLPMNYSMRAWVNNELSTILYAHTETIHTLIVETPETSLYPRLQSTSITADSLRLIGTDYEKAVYDGSGKNLWIGVGDALNPAHAMGNDANDQFRISQVRCATAIPDYDRSGFCGIVSAFVRTSVLEALFQKTFENYADSNVTLLDAQGGLIATRHEVAQGELLQLYPQMAGKSGFLDTQTGKGAVLLTYLRCASTGWTLFCVIPKRDMQMLAYGNLAFLGFSLGMLILVCLGVSLITSQQVLGMLKPLLTTMKRIDQGDLAVRVKEDPDLGELNTISHVFNQTLDHYDALLKKNYQQENMLVLSRLDTLRGQLSSHFLYNTLDSINWTLIERNQTDLSQSLVKLANLLRYSIGGSNDFVPLTLELKAAVNYLDICKLRFEDRLDYAIEVEDDLYNMAVPRFLLQPIIENAIVHGIEKMPDGGELRLRGYRREQSIVLDIFNNGPEISVETCRQLLHPTQEQRAGNRHIGLSNIIERLQLLYGDEYGVRIIRGEPNGTTIRILLPLPDAAQGKEKL